MKRLGLYECWLLFCFLLLPGIAIYINISAPNNDLSMQELALKWFVFSGVGLRLSGAGVKQILAPRFTYGEIFRIEDPRAGVLVQELGFANVSIGALAILSLPLPEFLLPAAVVGTLFFLMAGLSHLLKPKSSGKEWLAMGSDLFIALLLLWLLLIH